MIDGDQDGNGFDQSDMFFDTITNLASRGALQGQAPAFRGDLSDSVGAVTFTVDDGGTMLIVDLEHFDAGEHVVFTVDVDEAQHYDPSDTDWDVINGGFDTIASGVEFQATKLTATIAAPHFYEVTGTDTFLNAYDSKFAGKGLELPADNAGGFVNRTAGGVVTLQQSPLPITISGTVFKDPNLNNHQDASDPGISGVQLELWVQNGSSYVSTGHTAVTDTQGNYRLEGAWLLAGHVSCRRNAARRALLQRRFHGGQGRRRHARLDPFGRFDYRHRAAWRREQHSQRLRRGAARQPERLCIHRRE